ncbi:hypothetical protein SAMN05880501_10822 [Ureibacillus xyleni]|uniref:Uncharacterized protein n=1 Tax=Ureibacillus xyleni TaxID=614648 RepID=A0A285T1R6_9BACL|nr:hypothetical protein [Ureibacillus xyleni]SOC15024.1 hypothetical protein SAMN05880501_10822 [Ureibacillus xyleni]
MKRCNTCKKRKCTCQKIIDILSPSDNQPPKNPTDLFGSPFNCRKQKKTRRFASPNSPLSVKELDELQACIEEVNDLLRSLGSESDPNNTRQLQLHFLDLKGVLVSAQIITDEDEEIESDSSKHHKKIINLSGRIATAGRDFLQINEVGSSTFILYRHLLSVTRVDDCDESREPEFIDVNQETRRELAFNFGQFVGKNPDLVNLFFGIRLYLFLKKYIGKDVQVHLSNECITGTLIETDEGKITVKNKLGEIELSISEILYLEVMDVKS